MGKKHTLPSIRSLTVRMTETCEFDVEAVDASEPSWAMMFLGIGQGLSGPNPLLVVAGRTIADWANVF